MNLLSLKLPNVVSPEERRRFLFALFTSLGGVHAAVGVTVATFGFVPLWGGAMAGAAAWWVAFRYLQDASLKTVFARAYLMPVVALALVYCANLDLGDWSVAPLTIFAFFWKVVKNTPLLLVFSCIGYACLSADQADEKPPSPLDKPN